MTTTTHQINKNPSLVNNPPKCRLQRITNHLHHPPPPTSGLRGGASRAGSGRRKKQKPKSNLTTPKSASRIPAPNLKQIVPVEPRPPHFLIRTDYTTTVSSNPGPQPGFLTLKYGQGSDNQTVRAKFSEVLGGSWWYGSEYDSSAASSGQSYILGTRGWKRDLQGRVLSRGVAAGGNNVAAQIGGLVNGRQQQSSSRVGNGRMAPVSDPEMGKVQDGLKSVIQNLFDIQMNIHGYQDETHPYLVEKMIDLTTSLSALQQTAQPSTTTNGHNHNPLPSLPPELIDYVDEGRNPDIYTREFVELVQRGNAVINGKREGFKGFSEILAGELVEEQARRRAGDVDDTARMAGSSGWEAKGVNLEKAVDKVMRNAGIEKPTHGWGGPSGDGHGRMTEGANVKRESVSGHGMGNGIRDLDGDRKMEGT